jgi:hypothetical protein
MTPNNPVVGGTVLRRSAIQSPNFVQSPLQGWAINADGSAYFADVTAEGTITASGFSGTNWVINSSGAFFYSGSPAAGNMVASVAPEAGTDAYGNNYLAGAASYGSTFASAVIGGAVLLYDGSQADGWTQTAQIETSSEGDLILVANRHVSTSNNTLDDGSGNMTVSGSQSVDGSTSTSTEGLPNGTISGTSGGASAGTAHTHGPGSFAVTDGQHSHVL